MLEYYERKRKGVSIMILVSVIGDFYSSVLPLFYEYKDKITKHIIIYDDFKNDIIHARKIINGTTNFIKNQNLNIQTFSIKIDEDSILAIKKVIEILQEHANNYEEFHLNITDGLANIGLLLSNEFLPKGAKILTYDRYDNEYNILTKNSMQTHKMQTSIPIKEHLLLKDIEIVSLEGTALAQRYEKDLTILFEKYEADRAMYVNSTQANSAFTKIATGFLYEQYIFNLIKDLDYDDIQLGVKVKDKRLDGIYLENEYDILLMKNNHLHMIECKYLKVLDTTALLYKLDSVRETLDEDANIFIITDFDIYDETQDLPNSKIAPSYKRAFAKKIYMRGSPRTHKESFIKEVDKNFALHTKNIDKIIQSKESFPSLKSEEREKMKKNIQNYLAKKLNTQMDFFDKSTLLLLMQYKTYKKSTQETIKAMQEPIFKEFILLLNKMLTSKKEYISIYDVYTYYEQHLK